MKLKLLSNQCLSMAAKEARKVDTSDIQEKLSRSSSKGTNCVQGKTRVRARHAGEKEEDRRRPERLAERAKMIRTKEEEG